MKRLVVETDKLKHNIDTIKGMTESVIIAVLKGNGYGLGLVRYADFLIENGIVFFAVAEINEALCLRENGFSNKILLLTPACSKEQAEIIAANHIIPTIGSVESAQVMEQACADLGIVLDVHLKLDTGFGRFGFLSDKLPEYYELLNSLKNLNITGTYSHFSFSFSKNTRSIDNQFEKFMKSVNGLKENGINPGMLHIANSCAFLRCRELHLDAVRIGSAFLGRIPIENKYHLKKVGYLESCLIETKELPERHFVGYANTYQTKGKVQIGIIPVGYKDGFGIEKARDTFRFRDILRYLLQDIKQFKKKRFVVINGKKARLLGKVSMFHVVADITGLDVQTGDTAVLDINPLMVDSAVDRVYI